MTGMDRGWQALADELARWRDGGHAADIWWRDDDAIEETAALDRLLALQEAAGVPLALAVVPAQVTPGLAARLRACTDVDVLQHGYAHANHGGPSEKKIELGLQRPAMMVLGDLATGWMGLERLFGGQALPVMVPPWNRIAVPLVPTLPEIGYRGLSTFGPRPRALPVRGLRQVNTHVDLVDWKNGRRFVGEPAALQALVTSLSVARERDREPVGLLSHHLAMDAEAWDFLEAFLERTKSFADMRTCPARLLFAP